MHQTISGHQLTMHSVLVLLVTLQLESTLVQSHSVGPIRNPAV